MHHAELGENKNCIDRVESVQVILTYEASMASRKLLNEVSSSSAKSPTWYRVTSCADKQSESFALDSWVKFLRLNIPVDRQEPWHTGGQGLARPGS